MRISIWGRGALVFTGTLLLASGAGTALADEGSARSDSHAANVGSGESNIAVGHSTADSGSGETSAHSLEVNGAPASASTGGSAGAGQQAEGAAFDTNQFNPEGQGGRLALMPWTADGVSGRAFASFLVVQVNDQSGNEAVYASLLESTSEANGGSATGSSNAAVLRLGGDQLAVTIVHTEAATDGTGLVYVVGVNENTMISSDDANGQCGLEVPGVAKLSCLNVASAAPEVVTAALDGNVGDGSLAALLIGTQVRGAQQSAPAPDPISLPEDTFSRSGVLAATGEEAVARIVAGLGLLLAALAAWLAARRQGVEVGLTEIRTLA